VTSRAAVPLILLLLTAAAPADDLARLRHRLVELGKQEKSGVAKAQTAAARLSALNAAEAELKARVGANQQSLSRLLAALQSYQRNPPPALLVDPRSARQAVDAAILMRAVAPELERRAKSFAAEGKRLNALRRQILIADGEFLGAEHDVADRRAEMDALDEEKARLEGRLNPVMGAEAAASVRLGTTAGSVDELVKGVQTPETTTGSAAELEPKDVRQPVAGAPVRRYGEASPGHGRSEGWSWSAPQGALVTAPISGQVVYAGPLKGWGFVVILKGPGGYHLVLAGLERVSARVGGEVAAGEPVGRIATPQSSGPGKAIPAPELYLEIRRGAQTVDPAHFFAGATR
jgi:septal ring factor EnvC (AmiA/AmiB activator)